MCYVCVCACICVLSLRRTLANQARWQSLLSAWSQYRCEHVYVCVCVCVCTGRLATVATQMGAAGAAVPLTELSKGVANMASIFGGE